MRDLSEATSSSSPLTTPTARITMARLLAFEWASENESALRTVFSYQTYASASTR